MIVSIVGARPQFVKAGPVTAALRAASHCVMLVHTGQHYDDAMSAVFFDELGLSAPDVDLGVGSGPHGWQTARMLVGIEDVLSKSGPRAVLVYGDTNSTLAGALAAAKMGIPLAHVEAGVRSYNRSMPEEHNRVVTDRCADVLLCPTPAAVANLAREGIERGVHLVGDPMRDAVLDFRAVAAARSTVLQRLGLEPGGYLLLTVHRPSNADDPDRLRTILDAVAAHGATVVFPVHPRTRPVLALAADAVRGDVRVIEPVGYLDSLALQAAARAVVTDSGGMQKEAYLLGTPCITLREETEWTETVDAGWNVLVGADPDRIRSALEGLSPPAERPALYGTGRASARIVEVLERELDAA